MMWVLMVNNSETDSRYKHTTTTKYKKYRITAIYIKSILTLTNKLRAIIATAGESLTTLAPILVLLEAPKP